MAETFHLYIPTLSKPMFPATLPMRIGFKEGSLVEITVIFTANNMDLQNITAFPFKILEVQMGFHTSFPAAAIVVSWRITLQWTQWS